MEPRPNADTPFLFNPTVRLMFVNVVALMAIGLLMVYSAGLSVNPEEKYTLFTRQLIFVPLAIGALLLGMRLPYWKLNRRWVAVAVIALTVLAVAGVLVFGTDVNGSCRWYRMRVGPLDLSLQPSELAKVGLIAFFAWFLSREKGRPSSLRSFLLLAGVLAAVCGLIAYQDLGTAALIGVVGVALMIAGGVRLRHLAMGVPLVAGGLYVLIAYYPYRIQRLMVYLNPWQDAQGDGYQITQSLMAIGSGGWFGRGLGYGVQKLHYLPADTTDFIFSIICEEMGVVGGAMVILLFLVLTILGLRVVLKSTNRFGFLLALGIVLWTGLQALINIGVAMGALPTKGISLPLVSYGGTSLVITAGALGLVMSVAARAPGLAPQPPQPVASVNPEGLIGAVR